MTWSRRFDTPIDADGEQFVTLRDAGHYIANLPKSRQRQPHWQTATDMLLKAAEQGWPVMFAEIAMRRALDHGKPAPVSEPRRRAAKKFKVVS